MEKFNLTRGAPVLDDVPMDAILGNTTDTRTFEQLIVEHPEMMTYKGSEIAGHNFIGFGPFRETLAKEHGVEPDQIIVRNGGMDIMSKVLLMLNYRAEQNGEKNRRIRVATEVPTYDRFPINLQIHRMDWVGIPIDPITGLDLEKLKREIAGGKIDMLYLIDPGQNPSSYNYKPEEREEINKICKAHGVIVMWDRAYEQLVYDDTEIIYEPLPAGSDHVIISRNYTKEIAAGGIKTGYVVVPKGMVADMNQVICNEGLNAGSYLSQAKINDIITAPDYLRHINMLRAKFKARAEAIVKLLQTHSPDATFNTKLNSGYFVEVDYPGVTDREVFLQALEQRGLSFCDSTASYPPDMKHLATGKLRYPFVLLDQNTAMPEVIKRVSQAHKEVLG